MRDAARFSPPSSSPICKPSLQRLPAFACAVVGRWSVRACLVAGGSPHRVPAVAPVSIDHARPASYGRAVCGSELWATASERARADGTGRSDGAGTMGTVSTVGTTRVSASRREPTPDERADDSAAGDREKAESRKQEARGTEARGLAARGTRHAARGTRHAARGIRSPSLRRAAGGLAQ